MIYFTSDLHLGHRSIIGMQNRPFRDEDEMNSTIIHNINSMVTNGDRLFILGDISHRINAPETDALVRRIRGKKTLLLGNHDLAGAGGGTDYDPSLFDGICDYKILNEYGMILVLMHYPMISWYRERKGSIMLHGHIHARREYNENNILNGICRFDVGVDANNFFPVPITVIREWAKRAREASAASAT